MKINTKENVSAEQSASILPIIRPPPSLSRKIITIPNMTKNTATQCSSLVFSLSNKAANSAVVTGQTYCRRIALAAVVYLLAATNNIMVAALASAAATWYNEKCIFGFLIINRITMEAIKLLPPAMVKGFQGISLMSMPDVLQSSAVPARARIPYSWFRDKFCFIEDLKQKIIN